MEEIVKSKLQESADVKLGLDAEIIVNLQADEPWIEPANILSSCFDSDTSRL